MRNRLSEWCLVSAESVALPGVENFLEELASNESSVERDREASFFSQRETQPLCGYDLAETVNRRRAIAAECKLSYAKIRRGMQFSVCMNTSFEFTMSFMLSPSLTWFLEIAPALVSRNAISADMFYRISANILGVKCTRDEIDKLTANFIRKVGLFKEATSANDAELLVQYRSRAHNFPPYPRN